MLKIYLTRHGQTQWNIEGRMQGHNDSPLTQDGIDNAERLRMHLNDTCFDVIYSSPIGRSVKTAEIIRGKKSIPIILDDSLKEMDLSIWEGLYKKFVEEKYPEEYQIFWGKPHLYKPKGSESFFDVQQRALAFIKKIITEKEQGNVLLVTHTIPLRSIMIHYSGFNIENLWNSPYIHNTSLSILDVECKNVKISLYGDTSHLVLRNTNNKYQI